MLTTTTTTRSIQSLDRAFTILNELSAEPDGLSLCEIGRRVGIAVQTTQGLLRTLQKHGYVTQASRGAPYMLGGAPEQLSRKWQSMRTPPAQVRSELMQLCSQINEYVILAELRGINWSPLLEYNSNHSLIIQSERSQIDALHTTATGQILMANTDAATLDQIIAQLDFRPYGPASINDEQQLRQYLKKIALEDKAVCVEQRSEGIAAIAVAIKYPNGKTMALGASVPMPRYSAEREQQILTSLNDSARRIQQYWR